MPKKIANVRNNLLEKGRVMLLADGYFGFSISQLAHKCNIATGTFYRYFSSKAKLTEVIVQSDWDEMLGSMDMIVKSQIPFNKKLEGIYLELKKFSDLYLTVWTQFSAEKGNTENFASIKETCIKQLKKRVRQIIVEVVAANPQIQLTENVDMVALIIIHNLFVMARTPIFDFKHFADALWKWALVTKK